MARRSVFKAGRGRVYVEERFEWWVRCAHPGCKETLLAVGLSSTRTVAEAEKLAQETVAREGWCKTRGLYHCPPHSLVRETMFETTKTKRGRAPQAELLNGLSGMKLLGSLVNWNDGRNHGVKNTFSEVVKALLDNGLDAKVAKEFLPTSAFSRACTKLREDRVIDELKQDADHIMFQFSRQHVKEDLAEGGTEVEWRKEVKVLLDKATGKLECKDEVIKKQAQDLLDRCLRERTTSDVSNIIGKLFEQEANRPEPELQADLIRVGEGMFFVPDKAAPFLDKIQGFMSQLGRHINRFPVPAGTQHGDRSVQESVTAYLEDLVDEHKRAIEGFTVTTQDRTLEQAADRINATRVKIEAYADYLGDQKGRLERAAAEANEALFAQVDKLDEERKNAPPTANGAAGRRYELLGHPVTAVLRWMGKHNWKFARARAALDHYGVAAADATVKIQLAAGRKGERGEPAALSPAQEKELESLGG